MTIEYLSEEPGRDPLIGEIPADTTSSVGTPVEETESTTGNKGFDAQPPHEDISKTD